MSEQNLLVKLNEILELPAGTLKGDETLSDLENWDSLAVMNYIALISDQCGVTLSPRMISSCKSVSDLLRLSQPQS